MTCLSRIAPTPSGYLHVGNIYSFLITRLLTSQRQGKLMLRIDDLDELRLKMPYLQDVFEALQFMGINYDTGPKNIDDFFQNHSQHLRVQAYNELLKKLVQTGLVYACSCSRKELLLYEDPAEHHKFCSSKKLSLDSAGACWRIHVPQKTSVRFIDENLGEREVDLYNTLGDFIIKRKDGIPSYQVASLADDSLYGINFIVRGMDLVNSTAAQLYLAQLTDNRLFLSAKFYHHPLITNDKGEKLSKSAGSQSIRHLMNVGFTREDIISLLSSQLNSSTNLPFLKAPLPLY